MTMKRHCFDVIGEWDIDLESSQDDDICFRLAKHFKFGLIRENLGIYHVDATNRIGSSLAKAANGYFNLLKKFESDICKHCGNEIIFNRYLDCSQRFFKAGDFAKGKEIFALAGNYFNMDACWEYFCSEISSKDVYCLDMELYREDVAKMTWSQGIALKAFIANNSSANDTTIFISSVAGIARINQVPDDDNAVILIPVNDNNHEGKFINLNGFAKTRGYTLTQTMLLWLKLHSWAVHNNH